MDRRTFLSASGKLVAGAAIGSIIPGCDDPRRLYNCVKQDQETGVLTGKYCFPLVNGKTWSNFQDTNLNNARDPSVIKDGQTYKMWYTLSSDTTLFQYATSSNGINWSTQTTNITTSKVGAPFDSGSVMHPTVIKVGGTYKMWYQGGVPATPESYLLYCSSTDGINWSNFQVVVDGNASSVSQDVNAGQSRCEGPCVIKDSESYKMWYNGFNGAWSLLYCDSQDGINWSNYQVCNESLGGPFVINDNSTYKLWGHTSDLLYCESGDGVQLSNPSLGISFGHNASVINDLGVGKMWYVSNSTTPFIITYAESR